MGLQPLKSMQFANGSEWYEVSDEYDASVSGFSGDYEYYGYLNISGKWIIQQHQISTGAYRYACGNTAYATIFAEAIAGSFTSFGYYNVTLSDTTP